MISRLIVLAVLSWPGVAAGQVHDRDQTVYARAESLFWRGDSLAESADRANMREALTLWRAAATLYSAGGHLEEVASTFQHAGAVYNRLGRPDSALVNYRRALRIWRELGDRSSEARMLHNIADVLDEDNQPDSALLHYAQAVAILRDIEDGGDEATTLAKIGGVHARLDRPDSALANYGRALRIQRRMSDRSGETTTLNNIGSVYVAVGLPDSALAYFALVLTMDGEHGNRSDDATTLSNIGLIHAEVGRPDSALVYYARALSIDRRISDREGEATTLNNIGAVHRDVGRPDSATAYFSRSLAIRLDTGDRAGEATVLSNIGILQQGLGRADSALASYGKALVIRREIGDRTGEATTLSNIGVVQDQLGRQDSALAYSHQSLRILRETGNRRGEGSALNNIGLAYHKLGRADSALVYYALALEVKRQTQDRAGEGSALGNIASLYDGLGRADSALTYFARSLSIHRQVGNRASEATSLSNIGSLHHRLGRPDSALAYYAHALRIERAVEYVVGEAVTLHNIAVVLLRSEHAGSARSAAATFDSSAALRGRMRRSAGSDANAVSLSETGGETFTGWSRAWDRLAGEASDAGDTTAFSQAVAASLAAAERGRAQALRDLLDRNTATPAIVGLDASDTIAGADLAAEAGRLLAPLRRSRTALLYYLADGDTLRTWFLGTDGSLSVLSPVVQRKAGLIDRIVTARAQIGADEAAAMARRGETGRPGETAFTARSDVTGTDLGGDLDSGASDAALAALSASVLPAGLELLLPPGVELVIVPTGALGQVPFAALTVPHDTLPLGLRNAIRYAPSLRALVTAQATDGLQPVTGAEKLHLRALVVGNPEMPRVRARDGTARQLSPLTGAAGEAAWVATRLGASLLTGAAATERVVRDMMPAASIIHLATHGLAYGTEARVRDSYVALTPGAGHDGFFTLGELLDDNSIRLSADLIVLSACQTGLGETRQAEGTVGLQRGLLAKGARSVLVSLWSVDDAATQMLMERFYTHWLGPDNRPVIGKAEALRRAQADVRAVPSFHNPRYWAAFQLVGLQ